jgi:hypothetical protein
MPTKQLAATCLIVAILLAGCSSKVSLTKGGAKLTIPFDFPQDKTNSNNGKTSATLKLSDNVSNSN